MDFSRGGEAKVVILVLAHFIRSQCFDDLNVRHIKYCDYYAHNQRVTSLWFTMAENLVYKFSEPPQLC